MAHAQAVRTIEFQDHGQDFLEWDLDKNGKVVECRPFQGWMWEDRVVLNERLRKGSHVQVTGKYDGDELVIKYPLIRVTRVSPTPAR